MNFRKLGLVFLVALLTVFLMAPVAEAKKKGPKKSKPSKKESPMSTKGEDKDTFQVGADLGANVFGFIPYASMTTKENNQETDASFSGTGGFGPIFGAHFHLFFAEWIVRAEFAYGYQGGTATADFGDKKVTDAAGNEVKLENRDFDYAMNNVKLGAGIGKVIVPHKIVRPYILGVIDYHYLTFRDKEFDESASGSGIGLGVMLGLDARFMKHYFAGGGIRADFIYTVNPLTLNYKGKEETITMGYVPISLFLTGGYAW